MAVIETIISAVMSAAIGGAIALIVYQLRAKHDMRMAVLDKRFQAHQEADQLIHKFENLYMGNAKKDELFKIFYEADDWWSGNNLYLDVDARQAVSDAFICMVNVADVGIKEKPSDLYSPEMTTLSEAREALQEAVLLPPIKKPMNRWGRKYSI